MDRLAAIEAFVEVARAGGFSAAARRQGGAVANVSRRIAELESALGVRLFTRSTRHVELTEAGRLYFEACARLLEDLRDAEDRVAAEHRVPRGQLRLTAPLSFGRLHLQPVLHEFLSQHPDIDLSLELVDRVVALVEEHVDCAVRISALPDSSLIARPLGTIRMVVCAAPSYLAANGSPAHPSELERHHCIAWTALGPHKTWDFRLADGPGEARVPIRVRITTSTQESAVDAAFAGLGLVQATSYLLAPAVADGRLVPVLREYECAAVPVSLVYASKRLLPSKLRAFLDFSAPMLESRLRTVADVLDRGATAGFGQQRI